MTIYFHIEEELIVKEPYSLLSSAWEFLNLFSLSPCKGQNYTAGYLISIVQKSLAFKIQNYDPFQAKWTMEIHFLMFVSNCLNALLKASSLWENFIAIFICQRRNVKLEKYFCASPQLSARVFAVKSHFGFNFSMLIDCKLFSDVVFQVVRNYLLNLLYFIFESNLDA